jgi:hypothetical protein
MVRLTRGRLRNQQRFWAFNRGDWAIHDDVSWDALTVRLRGDRKERVMSNGTTCDLLAARFEKKAADGLLDVKFLLQPNEATADEVCQEVERLYDTMGESRPLDFGDLRWKD